MFAIRSRSLDRCLLSFLLLIASCAATAFQEKPVELDNGSAQTELAEAAANPQRGRLLYDTHCIACHTTDVHWRDKHIVQSWSDLLYQVDRMQKNAGQKWEMAEIIDVAAYLNDEFYQMPCPVAGCGRSHARVDQRPAFARLR
jgi:mono/diheme cytochrome c family protein